MKVKTHFILLLCIIPLLSNAKEVNILDFRSVPDGKTDNTVVIQKAIDQYAATGGETVYTPSRTYISGSIFLKDNITLELDKLAVLKGMDAKSAYPDEQIKGNSFIRIDRVANVSIIGEGKIEGNGGDRFSKKEMTEKTDLF